MTPLSVTFHWDLQSEIYPQLSHIPGITPVHTCDIHSFSLGNVLPSSLIESILAWLKKKQPPNGSPAWLRLCASKAGLVGSTGLGTKEPSGRPVAWPGKNPSSRPFQPVSASMEDNCLSHCDGKQASAANLNVTPGVWLIAEHLCH